MGCASTCQCRNASQAEDLKTISERTMTHPKAASGQSSTSFLCWAADQPILASRLSDGQEPKSLETPRAAGRSPPLSVEMARTASPGWIAVRWIWLTLAALGQRGESVSVPWLSRGLITSAAGQSQATTRQDKLQATSPTPSLKKRPSFPAYRPSTESAAARTGAATLFLPPACAARRNALR